MDHVVVARVFMNAFRHDAEIMAALEDLSNTYEDQAYAEGDRLIVLKNKFAEKQSRVIDLIKQKGQQL